MANVLLIDDDPTVRDVLGDMLTSAGYHVAAAEGITAMDEFESNPFDVVIADIFSCQAKTASRQSAGFAIWTRSSASSRSPAVRNAAPTTSCAFPSSWAPISAC